MRGSRFARLCSARVSKILVLRSCHVLFASLMYSHPLPPLRVMHFRRGKMAHSHSTHAPKRSLSLDPPLLVPVAEYHAVLQRREDAADARLRAVRRGGPGAFDGFGRNVARAGLENGVSGAGELICARERSQRSGCQGGCGRRRVCTPCSSSSYSDPESTSSPDSGSEEGSGSDSSPASSASDASMSSSSSTSSSEASDCMNCCRLRLRLFSGGVSSASSSTSLPESAGGLGSTGVLSVREDSERRRGFLTREKRAFRRFACDSISGVDGRGRSLP